MEDQLTTAARALKDIEARVLTRFAAGESATDIAINLELTRTAVVSIIKEKGMSSSGYALNLVKIRSELAAAVRASRSTAPRPPAPPRRATKATTAPKTVTPQPEPTPRAVDAAATVRKAENPAPARDDTAAAAARSAPPVAEQPAIREDDPPMPSNTTQKAPATVPYPRAADLEFTPIENAPTTAPSSPIQPASDGDPVIPDTIEDVLAIAEVHTDDTVRDLATKLRENVDALRNALLVDHRAAGLRTQIAEIDSEITGLQTEIDVRITKRDQLRKELEELLAGDVTVSVSSSPRTPRTTTPAPSDDTIRQWAIANHFTIPRSGDIPNGVRAAYQRAQGNA